jgi:hypothetical protein
MNTFRHTQTLLSYITISHRSGVIADMLKEEEKREEEAKKEAKAAAKRAELEATHNEAFKKTEDIADMD